MNILHVIRTAGFIALLAGVETAPARDLTAKDVIRMSDSTMRGTSSYAEITMSIVKPEWSREMSLKAWSLGDDYGLVLVTAPPRDNGSVTLKRDTEVWNWLPGIERVIKIPPSMMLQSWLGSDFTNDDLVKESSVVNDYTHSFAADTVIEGSPCYRIMMIPRENAAVVWGKVIVSVTKVQLLQVRSEMYDEDGELSKVLTADRIKRMSGRMVATRLVMEPAGKQNQRTIMEYSDLQFDIPLQESFFSLQNMRRVR
jgi:outer membrane lipoprotein-sorting protein